MPKHNEDQQLAHELRDLLSSALPGVEVEVGRNPRWSRRCLTFRWAGFENLLPEERFYRLVQVIPEEFRTSRLAGCVWLELAPGESIEEFLKHPRSEDVADREEDIYSQLVECGFFMSLADDMGQVPDAACKGDFSRTARVFSEKGLSREAGRDAKLALIRNGAFCDCQVLGAAQQSLASLHAGAA